MAAAAAALSLSLSPDPPHLLHLRAHHHPFTPPPPYLLHTKLPNLISRPHFKPSFSHSPRPPPLPTTAAPAAAAEEADTPTPFLDDPFRPLGFLTNEEFEKLRFLESYSYSQELRSGRLTVRVMRAGEMDETVKLLAESFAASFADSKLLPTGYVTLLQFLVKQYLVERRGVMPHAVTLLGFYRGRWEDGEEEGEEEELAGTVEVCFDKRGSNASPPTPTAPRNSPYICNMTVREQLRRRGIGWHLLKACEELISRMGSSREVYLHCRMIDLGPFNMYTKAGYRVVNTDGFLVLLMFQRRKHLMCKELPPVEKSSQELDDSRGTNEEQIPSAEES